MSNLSEESTFWLPHYSGFAVRGELQPRHKGPGAEGQTVFTFVVASFVDGDEKSSIQYHSGEKCSWFSAWTQS